MKKLFFILPIFLVFACKSPEEKALAEIKTNEDALYNQENDKVNEEAASELIAAYGHYANEFPEKEATPEYLFKKAELHRSIEEYEEAVETWKIIYEEYPEYKKAPFSLFLQGFVYENDLNNINQAKAKYSEFLKKYPNHELARDVQFSLAHLGKSPQDIIRGFEQKNAAAASQDSVDS